MIRWILTTALLSLPIVASAQPRAGTGSIEARLERVEAHLAIERIQVDYAGFLDSRDYTHYVDLFTPDGEWINAGGTHKGRKAIREMLAMLGTEGAENKANYHLISNPRIDVDGDKAIATSRYLFTMRGPDGSPRPALSGVYTDDLVKVGGRWMIRRRVANDIMPSAEEWRKIIAAQNGPNP